MNDNNNLKEEIKKLNERIAELETKLKENSEKDKKHHEELKELQKQQHEDNMKWQKIQSWGMFGTPLTLIISLITWYLKKKGDKNEKLDKVLELLEKQN